MTKKISIYVASSWRNELQPSVVAALLEAGFDVYDFKNPALGEKGFSWSSIDPNWKNWTPEEYAKALQHPIAEKGYGLDIRALKACEVCVLVLPSGRSASWELGYAMGQGKMGVVLQIDKVEPELMYREAAVVTSIEMLVNFLEGAAKVTAAVRSLVGEDVIRRAERAASEFLHPEVLRRQYLLAIPAGPEISEPSQARSTSSAPNITRNTNSPLVSLPRDIARKLLSDFDAAQWETHNAAENKVCAYYCLGENTYEDQHEHQPWCEFVELWYQLSEVRKEIGGEWKEPKVKFEQSECDHGVTFDEKAAKKLLDAAPPPKDDIEFIMGSEAHKEIRKRWPRGWFTEERPCPKGCGFVGIAYASEAHYTYGDW